MLPWLDKKKVAGLVIGAKRKAKGGVKDDEPPKEKAKINLPKIKDKNSKKRK